MRVDRSYLPYTSIAVWSILVTVLTSGCEQKQDALLDSRGTAPRIVSVVVSPTAIDTDSIFISGTRKPGDPIPLSIDAIVSVTHVSGSSGIRNVEYSFTGDDNDPDLASGLLADDGVLPDSVRGDGVFRRRITFTFLREPTISVWLKVQATDFGGYASNVVWFPLSIGGSNRPPLLSNLIMPDTVDPASASVFTISLTAIDPDGANDINRVERITQAGNRYPLAAVGNDIYSEQVSVSPAPTAGSYVFKFQATDKTGAVSNLLQKTIVIK